MGLWPKPYRVVPEHLTVEVGLSSCVEAGGIDKGLPAQRLQVGLTTAGLHLR